MQRAWIWRWMAAGFSGRFSRFRRALVALVTVPVSARTRWYGVAGAS